MLWVKTFHILFVIAWMAGLFYLPRILVHYVEGTNSGEDVRRLVTMADKLFKFATIMALLAMTTGLWLWLGYGISGAWLYLKLGFVVLLLGYHGQCFRYGQRMQQNLPIPSSLFFRIFNEAALMLVIPILILVVVKPFV